MEAAPKMLSQGGGPSASGPGSKPPPRCKGRGVEVEVSPKGMTAGIYLMGDICERQIPRPEGKPAGAGPGTLHLISSSDYSGG